MISRIAEKPALAISFLIVISAYLFFFQLGKMAFTDPDETFYAQTTKEMVQRNDWVTPYLYGKPQFEKPILFYWLTVASSRVFGVNEFSVRLPSAVFGAIGLIALYLLGGLMFNKRVGLLAALIMGTNVEYIVLAKACITDMVLTVCILLGVLAFFYARVKDKGSFLAASAAAFALATLTKGPIGIMLPVAAIVLYCILVRDRWILTKWMHVAVAAVVFVIITLPWYAAIYRIHGQAFIDAFFGFHNVNRFLEAEHKIGSQWYYYLPVMLGGLFPWSAFLPYALWCAGKEWTREGQGGSKPTLFLLTFLAVFVIFFSISSTKLPTYTFPAFMSLTLLIALAWDALLKGGSPSRKWAMSVSYYVLLIVVVAGLVGLFLFLKFDYPTIIREASVTGLVFLAVFMVSYAAFLKKRYAATFLLIAASAGAILVPLGMLVLPKIEPYETAKEISLVLRTYMKEGEALAGESNYTAGLTYYTGVIASDIDKHHNLVQFMGSDKRVWCVLKEKNHRQLYELDTKPWYTKPSYLVYRLGKKCIITNQVPEDGTYLLKRERQR